MILNGGSKVAIAPCKQPLTPRTIAIQFRDATVAYLFGDTLATQCQLLLYVTVKRHALTFMHRKYRCSGSQGPPGLGYGPLAVLVWLSGASKQSWVVSRQWPLPRMWHQMCHTESPVDDVVPHTSYSSGIKTVVPLSWGVLLPLRKSENISTPPASRAVKPSPGPPGHPCSFK